MFKDRASNKKDFRVLQKWLMILTLSLVAAVTGPVAQAQDSSASGALTFQAWKNQQVLEAQNQILRASARVTQFKSGRIPNQNERDASTTLSSNRIKKVNTTDSLAIAERDLKRAQESMEAANGLQVEHYVDVYLMSLQDQPETVVKLLEKLSKDELEEITRTLIRKGSRQPTNSRRSASTRRLEGATTPLRTTAL